MSRSSCLYRFNIKIRWELSSIPTRVNEKRFLILLKITDLK